MEAVIPVQLSGALMKDLTLEADRSGLSPEAWLRRLAEERLRELEVKRRFLAKASPNSRGEVMLEVLRSIRDNPPDPGDEL